MLPPRLAQLGFAERAVAGVEVIVPPVCDVPAGESLMGSDPELDRDAHPSERPQHRVTMPAFQIARFPVTVAEYARFLHAGSHREPLLWWRQMNMPDAPVVHVPSWRDATDYAGWLAEVTGEPWRLPSEAEWEKAARWDPAARHARIYPWGDAYHPGGDAYAAYHQSVREEIAAWDARIPRYPMAVGLHPEAASPCGAQDMAGNVWECTSSLYKPYPYEAHDGRERADVGGERVLRGGSWDCDPIRARAAARNGFVVPDFDFIGLRLARSLPVA